MAPSTSSTVSLINPLPLSAPKPSDELPAALQTLIAAALPADVLISLLTRHADAHAPQDARVIALTPDSVSISYLQPVREYWYHPLSQVATIRIVPTLPRASPETVAEIVQRLETFAHLDDIPVTRYVSPGHWKQWSGIAVFMGFTLMIVAHLLGVSWVEAWVFTTERRFNVAVGVHCVVLVKRSRDVRSLGELLGEHWEGGRLGRWLWVGSGWVEGWRAVARFREEVGRVVLERAAGEGLEGKKTK